MAHQCDLICEAVVAMLTNATTAGTRVDDTRIEPHKKSQLPAISVYSLSEDVEEDSKKTAPRELERFLNLEIAAWVAHSDSVPAVKSLRSMLEQVEAVMDGDRYLRGTAGESVYDGFEMQIVQDDGRSDPTVGVITIKYVVTYRTSPAAPANLDDFRTVDAKHQVVGGVADTVPAEDTFTVQETPP